MHTLALVMLAALMSLTAAQVKTIWIAETFPNPQEDIKECGRGKKSSVCDPNQILTPAEANQVDILIDTLKNKTRCPCASHTCAFNPGGYKVGVALANKIADPKDVDTENLDVKLHKTRQFAYGVLIKWDIGECKEDLVIAYSKEDQTYYTMVNEITKEKLHESDIGDIAMKTNVHFGGGQIFKGLQQVITSYQDVFNGHYHRLQLEEDQQPASGRSTSGAAGLAACTLGTILLVGASLLLH